MLFDEPVEAAQWRRFLAPAPLLWVAAALVAVRSGQPAGWRWAARTASQGWSGDVVIAAGVLAADMSLVLLTDMAAQGLRRLWTGIYMPWPVSSWLRRRRVARWDDADRRAERAVSPAERHRHERARNRIALARPQSPTWMGDRAAALETRIRNEYGLDLPSAWPRLWLVLPEPARTDLRRAGQAYVDASRWGSWSLVYAVTAFAWWPVAILAVVALAAAVHWGAQRPLRPLTSPRPWWTFTRCALPHGWGSRQRAAFSSPRWAGG